MRLRDRLRREAFCVHVMIAGVTHEDSRTLCTIDCPAGSQPTLPSAPGDGNYYAIISIDGRQVWRGKPRHLAKGDSLRGLIERTTPPD